MNTSSQTLQSQGSPILLLAQLLATNPELPAVGYRIDPFEPTTLYVSVHGDLGRFEPWRLALGLPAPEIHSLNGAGWMAAAGVVADVPVQLTGYGTTNEVAEVVGSAVSA